jgi:hypothetical protein
MTHSQHRATPVLPFTVAVIAGWLSFGVVSPVDAESGARVAVLPHAWVAFALVSVALCVSVALRPPAHAIRPLLLSGLLLLPWIPLRWPAALLIWAGPLIGWIWVAVALALAWPALARAARRLLLQRIRY